MTRRPYAAAFVACCVAHLYYQWHTAFTPSPASTAEAIRADGGHPYVLPDGRLLEYFVHGAVNGSKTLVALHGAQTTGNLFALLGDWATVNDVRIIAPTLPGFGHSTYSQSAVLPADWTADALLLLYSLGVDRFALLGTSLGSIYAAALVAEHPRPDAIQGVALYVAFAPADIPNYNPLAGSILETFGNLRSTPHYKRFLEKIVFVPLIYAFAPWGSDVRRAIATQWEGVNACADVIYAPWPAGWAAALANQQRRVVIVSGSKDAAAPPHNQARLQQLLPGSELVVYDGPHEHSLNHPSLFAEHVTLIM